jgi:hypothetical protein
LAPRADGTTDYYSEPGRVGGSFESRVLTKVLPLVGFPTRAGANLLAHDWPEC